MENRQSAVDIVIPVYNGYEDLVLCVESIKRHTDLTRHRVLIIDDCSPDERVREYLDGFDGAKTRDADCGFVILYNEKNQGFSANVNIGLAWSSRDTILLNSDTIVTRGWVEKLISCAHRSERIATVMPLSNAATIASVPVFLKDNPLPDGYTPDSYAELAERVSLHRYPRITTCVGFCMYVRQEAYEAAGEFDAKTFGRGYGEENDFCNRCAMLGFIHVLCDDTFIYHKGTASFNSEERIRLTQEHDRILRKRYPELMEKNDIYCREDPDSEIRDNLLLHQCLENGRKNLLYFLHLDFREIAQNNVGGTQLHVRDLVAGAKKDYNVFVAARDGDALRLTVYLNAEDLPQWRLLQTEESADADGRLISLRFPIPEEEQFPVFYDEKIAEVLRKVLVSFSIDLVHVHHTQGLSFDIFRVCRELDIPVVTTLHDYFYACPTTKLLTDSGKFCPDTGVFASPSDRACARCLHKNCGYGRVRVMERWRKACREDLSWSREVIFPSESARKIMLSAYPELAPVSRVLPHGTDAVGSGSFLSEEKGPVKKTDRVHTRLDQRPGEDGSFHYIAGWAYLEGADSLKTSILIEITSADGQVHYLNVKKNARSDVAAAASDPNCLWSGIHAVFYVPGLKEGKLKIRLLIRDGDTLWTDGKIYRASWHSASGDAGRLNCAFLGGVTPAKGSGLLKQVIGAKDSRFDFFVYGEVGDPTVKAPKGADNVFFSGAYQKDDIFDLLRISGIDVAIIAPKWAETFCYTLSEAWACGIPVIGTDIGAVGERIRSTGAGWLISPDAGRDELLELLAHIRDNPAELEEKKKTARSLALRTVEEMNAEYRGLYSEILSGDKAPDAETAGGSDVPDKQTPGGSDVPDKQTPGRSDVPDCAFIMEGLSMANPSVKGHGTASAQNKLREEIAMLRSYIEIVENTTSYRFARKISEADIPFKEPLKKLFKRR